MALSALKKVKREAALLQTPDSEDAPSNDESDATEASAEGNAGWADSIAKVLNTTKPKTKKTLVLSRAKKIKLSDKVKPSENFGFEVDGEVKEEKPGKEELEQKIRQRKNQTLALRARPSWKDMERERTLRKIGTKGVVQLFNAVRIQQKDLQAQLDEAGPLDSRKEAVLNNINKRKFLDVLMSGSRAKSEAVDNSVKYEFKNKEENSSSDDEEDEVEASADGKKKSEWNVLRQDFMTNKKIKHWDEDDEDNDSANNEEQSDGDGESSDGDEDA